MQDPSGHRPPHQEAWTRELFTGKGRTVRVALPEHPARPRLRADQGRGGALWPQFLFEGKHPPAGSIARLRIFRNATPIQDLDLAALKQETVIGRHPEADIQLEAQHLALFHACLWILDGECYIESLDPRHGALLDRKRLKLRHPVQLHDGTWVDLPGYRLQFILPDWPAKGEAKDVGLEEGEAVSAPDIFYNPYTPASSAPPPCPRLTHPVEARETLRPWTEGATRLKVADIVEESPDAKTFRLVGEPPQLFSYRPGQFVTLTLDIDGREARRSYSLSSSPSRPHTLDITVKRVPGGLVSNWLCDTVRLGDVLNVRGPSGKFTCFEHPSDQLLFIAAGSGVTPLMSMARWIVDTAANADVVLLASFRSPPDILFRRELEWMSTRHRGLRVALTVTSGWRGSDCWTGFTGRVSRRMITLLAPDIRERHIFMCGPEPFMASVRDILRELDYDLSRLHTESFGAGGLTQGSAPAASGLQLEEPLYRVRFTRSGLTVETDGRTSLLELAEAHGVGIDCCCRSGSCGECLVRCRGDVAVRRECEIDADQRAKGWIYACATMARGDLELDA